MANTEEILAKQFIEATKIIEDQVDNEIQKLEQMTEDDYEILRKKRLEALKRQEAQKQKWLSDGHGEYSELADEKQFFDTCNNGDSVVVHFYRDSTFRCKVVDKHLNILAKKHIETKFCKIDVEKAPFLTQRLKIKVLPSLVSFKEGKTKDFVVGFDDLGGTDEFSTEMLEWRLARSGVLHYSGDLTTPPGEGSKKKPGITIQPKKIRGVTQEDSDEEDLTT